MNTFQKIAVSKEPTIGVFWSDGILMPGDRHEICKGKWAPLMVYKKKGESQIYVPVCGDLDTTSRFIQRNIPAHWTKGAMTLLEDEIRWCLEQGWLFDRLTFPKRMVGNPNLVVSGEVMEYQSEPELIYREKT